jgi:hypothetical protein
LKEVNALGGIKGHRWPQNPRAVSSRLRRDAKLLPELKMEFDIKEGRNRDRLLVIEMNAIAQPCEAGTEVAADRPKEKNKTARKTPPISVKGSEMPLFKGA